MRRPTLLLVAVLALGACAAGGDDDAQPNDGNASESSGASGAPSPVEADPALRKELLEMARQDQAERTGQGGMTTSLG